MSRSGIPFFFTFGFLGFLCILSFDSVFGQTRLIEIEWDAYRDRNVTTLSGKADMVPTSESYGVFNFASVRLARVDLKSGAVVDEFDDTPLDRYASAFVTKVADTTISLYDHESILRTPTCQRHIYIYKHLYQVPGSTDVVCEVSATLRKSGREDYPFYQLELIVRLTEELDVCSIHIREKDLRFLDGGSYGGAVVDDTTMILTYKSSVKGVPAHYIYTLIDGVYVCVQPLSQLAHQESFPWYEISRYPAAYLLIGQSVYSSNGKYVIRKSNLFSDSADTLSLDLGDFEAITHLCEINSELFVGLKGVVGKGKYDEWELFIADKDMEGKKNIGSYSEKSVYINGLSTFGTTIYILLFDNFRRKMLLHSIDLENGPPSRRFAFTDVGNQ